MISKPDKNVRRIHIKIMSFDDNNIRVISWLYFSVELFIIKMFFNIEMNLLGRNLYGGLFRFIIPAVWRASATNSEQKKVFSCVFATEELNKYKGSNLYFVPLTYWTNVCSFLICSYFFWPMYLFMANLLSTYFIPSKMFILCKFS